MLLPFSLRMESTTYILSSRMVFFYLVTTGWISINKKNHSKSMDQPVNVANPARGQLNRENEYFPVRVQVYK